MLLLFSFSAFPAVFVVTSNAASGPGTLADALTKAAANGNATKDYIHFNLPGTAAAARTIMLTAQLPDVSSNLVIDGSTQPGAKFGVSDAKVALFFNTPVEQTLSGLSIVNQHDVEVYGLYIKNFTDTRASQTLYFWKGIELQNDKNVQIGAAGKGNVITGFYDPLVVNFPENELRFFENLTIEDNFFGVDADGETLSVNETSPVSLYYVVGTIRIGGTVAQGNLLAQGLFIYQGNMNDYPGTDPEEYYSSAPADFLIKNNDLGVDYTEQNSIPKASGLWIGTSNPNGKNTIHIEDNVITADANNAMYIINNGRPVTILRNYIGTNRARTKTFTTFGTFYYWDTNVAIGDDNPADANYITNCNPISIWPYTNATVNKNSIYCTVNKQPMHLGGYGQFPFPEIQISRIAANSVGGTATPNSKVELFYSDACKTCSPQTYFASTTADANGKWQYNGAIHGSVIASATIGGNTSEFTRATVNVDNVKIVNACSTNGLGSIKGAIPLSATGMTWVDEQGHVVGHNADLLNVPPGRYKLVVTNGDCTDSTPFYEIRNTFTYDDSQLVLTNPSCGNANGSIMGLQVFYNNDDGASSGGWKDASGNWINNDRNLLNVTAGSYYYSVTNSDQNCTETFGPFKLLNTTGPNVDQTTAHVQSTNCGQSTGSISNITATGTGTLSYIWWNSQQQQVGTGKDLLNQPAGTYKLQVMDNSSCGPVYTTDITIPETNGITLDESAVVKTNAGCGLNNGSITGITANGATRFEWMDANNHVVSTSANFTGAGAGDYRLTVSNNFGCSRQSAVYHVDSPAPIQFPQYNATITSSCFANGNGTITVTTDALVKTLRWVDAQGSNVGNQPAITNLAPGTYKLYLTDQNGCEGLYNSYAVGEIPEFTVASTGDVTEDQCGQKTGAISNVTIAGGVPPYTYSWTDGSGNAIGSTNSISRLSPGTYTLHVVDTRCGIVDIPYTITETTAEVAPPAVSDVALCSSGGALISVNEPSATTTYRLYEDGSSAHPIDERQGGRFSVNVTGNRSYFVSQFNGTCESSRAEIKVTVGLSAVNINNTFTPNGDGVNDYWMINSNIQSYPDAVIQVFTRYGQKVFEEKGYAKPFDGTMNGKKLPAGVYYYIIKLNNDCSILSGSLTIIR
ncbi:MAG TPA: gliding motility-associated C-terminal domain-containing protein [Mucilaginibacter sp.]